MGERDELLRAVDRLESLLRQVGDLIGNRATDNRKAILEARRLIAEQISIVAKLGTDVAAKQERAHEFRGEFSKLRSAIALHQASWPVVSINVNDPLYQKSVAQSREAYGSFLAWLKRSLAS